MPRPLPPAPSLEHLRKQAKDLLRAVRSHDPEALARVAAVLPPAPAPLPLAGAQHVLAREHGFASWPRLKAHLEETGTRRAALRREAERLGVRDWRVILAADAVLTAAGREGIEAALWGFSHPEPRVRRGCAAFMDHRGDDSCVAPLRELALRDPVPGVRRAAVHSLFCQRCKPSPLEGDLVDVLVHVALNDENRRVRVEAIGGLGTLPRDPRAAQALHRILAEETHPEPRRHAHLALKRQDPEYRRAVDERARAAGIARAKAAAGRSSASAGGQASAEMPP